MMPIAAMLTTALLPAPVLAAEAHPVTLVIALYAKPADRPALRAALERAQSAKLRSWEAQGVLSGYRLLFSRFADSGVWDAMEVMSFTDEAALTHWREIERQAPGGLNPDALGLVASIETTVSDSARGGGKSGGDPSILVIPYVSLVPSAEYLRYLDGYTIPQFDGWISEHVLDGYEILTSRFPADRKWNALIILRYHDDAALARRDEVVATVRARLALDPAWKAISDNKKAMRTEKALAVADQIAASDDAR
jgi:hypothetical protein